MILSEVAASLANQPRSLFDGWQNLITVRISLLVR